MWFYIPGKCVVLIHFNSLKTITFNLVFSSCTQPLNSPDSQDAGAGCSRWLKLGRTILVPSRSFCRTPDSDSSGGPRRPTSLPIVPRTVPAIAITTPDSRSDLFIGTQLFLFRVGTSDCWPSDRLMVHWLWSEDFSFFKSFLPLFSCCENILLVLVCLQLVFVYKASGYMWAHWFQFSILF